MARRKRGNPVHGWLILDKPVGMTSTQCVGAVRWLYQAQKAGHAGTLDPLASGVLPIALGEATKTVPFVMDGNKTYRFTIGWGRETDSGDLEGRVTEESPNRPDTQSIRDKLKIFIGSIQQVPPAYSAIKIDGERAYRRIRRDEDFDMPARTVAVYRFDLVSEENADEAIFEVECGKGTYVRSLARDLALALGTRGHVTALRRLSSGPFDESDAISLDKLRELRHNAVDNGLGGNAGPDILLAKLLSIGAALDDIPALSLTESEAGRLQNGQPVPVIRTVNRERIRTLADGDTLWAAAEGIPVALVRLKGSQVHPVRVFKY
jgi:tRNA pseudouridine55 synthase